VNKYSSVHAFINRMVVESSGNHRLLEFLLLFYFILLVYLLYLQ
jgi:hypothetical protein